MRGIRDENIVLLEEIKSVIGSAKYIVFFGGAGASTDSGIPDFRGSGGLYTAGESNEYYLSRSCLENEPENFYCFFKENMLFEDAEPNTAHRILASAERRGSLMAVITQNIDGLHQAAGSSRVIELHGSADRYYCTNCGKTYGREFILEQNGVPVCSACGRLVRPDITLYGEALDGFSFADAEREISNADVLIVGGTSLTVNPAASLIDSFTGDHLIIINYSPTPYDHAAEYVVRESLSDVLEYLF